MISIPKNTYKETTRCDEKVVQAICDTFLRKGSYRLTDPNSLTYHPRTRYVSLGKETDFLTWRDVEGKPDTIEFTNEEMDMAVKELLNAGYYLFRTFEYRTWETYFFRQTPHIDASWKSTRVDSIPHF